MIPIKVPKKTTRTLQKKHDIQHDRRVKGPFCVYCCSCRPSGTNESVWFYLIFLQGKGKSHKLQYHMKA
jgi:hypothetical protein